MGNPNNSNYWPNESYFRSLYQSFVNKTSSKVTVTPENAYLISAYWCAVRAISEDIAKLPVRMYTRNRDGDKKTIYNNPLLNVLTKGFNDETDSMTGIQTLIQWALTFGNGYCEIASNASGQIELYLIHPSRVHIDRDTNTGELYYNVESTTDLDRQSSATRHIRLSENEILHIKGMGNGVIGYNLAHIAGESLGISLAAQNFTSSFFGNNLSVGSTLETPRALDPDIKKGIRKEWQQEFGGSGKSGSLVILDRDFKFNRIQMASTDAELLKTREFQISEIARWFRIPPHKIMEMKGAKFNNVEQQNIEYVTDCLGPWITRLEKQLKFKFHRHDNTYIDLDEKALLRGDESSRIAFYKELYLMSAITPKHVAKLEGLPYEEASDKYYQQLNIQSVELTEESQDLDNQVKRSTLTDTVESEIELEPDPVKDESQQKVQSLSPQAMLSYYQPVMLKTIEALVNKEFRAHNAANKKQGYALTEHLDKFYSKFETEVADKLQVHSNYLTSVFGKNNLTRESILQLARNICQMEKHDTWLEVRPQEVIDILLASCLDMEDAPTIGTVIEGSDGKRINC